MGAQARRRGVEGYGLRPAGLEADDRRDVGDHIDEGAVGQARIGGHEVSQPKVIVLSWNAERIGPRIIAAPHRGHAHVAVVVVPVAPGAGDATEA